MGPPEMMNAMTDATALETAAAIRTGALSALEACEAAIARIAARNGPLNAVVVADFDRARAAAVAVDAARTPDDPRPLLGVPMTVKESIAVAGLPCTWGLPAFAETPVARDAVVVARLKAAGAVILGKTNAMLALADWQTANPLYGRTANPHDVTRCPGGSSGGAAAAVAAGMVALELGSDIGGSVRVPAHMCGVFGHKPTYGVIPLDGAGFPGTDWVDQPFNVLGPFARTVADLAAAFDVLAGPMDGTGYTLALPRARAGRLRDFRVRVLDAHPVCATDERVRAPLQALAERLAALGAAVTHGGDGLPDLAAAHEAYGDMLGALNLREAGKPSRLGVHRWMALQDTQARLIRQWRAVFETVDVVLAPPFGVAAFPHDARPWSLRAHMIDGRSTPYGEQLAWPGLATFPHLPATAAPIGATPEGLPVGVQIMGDAFADRTTLAFAALLEREGLAGYRPPR